MKEMIQEIKKQVEAGMNFIVLSQLSVTANNLIEEVLKRSNKNLDIAYLEFEKTKEKPFAEAMKKINKKEIDVLIICEGEECSEKYLNDVQKQATENKIQLIFVRKDRKEKNIPVVEINDIELLLLRDLITVIPESVLFS